MDIEKLKEVLASKGIPEEEIAEIIAQVTGTPNEEGDPKDDENDNDKEDGDPANGEPSADGDPNDDDDLPPGSHGDGAQEGDPAPADVPPTNPDEVPPAPGPQDVPPTDPVPPVPPVPPANDQVPPAPPVATPDPELVQKIEEQAKTIEGLKAQIDSLEEALQAVGVLDGDKKPNNSFGIDDPSAGLESGSVGAEDDFARALNKLNHKS